MRHGSGVSRRAKRVGLRGGSVRRPTKGERKLRAGVEVQPVLSVSCGVGQGVQAGRRARELLEPFLAPPSVAARRQLVEELRPRDPDFERVFVGAAAARARDVYRDVWACPPEIAPREGQVVLDVMTARSDELGDDTAGARAFPGGYRRCRAALRDGVTWVCWRFRAPGQALGLFYDGLVLFAERALWLPRPWTAVAPRGTLAYWVD
jgi:hypothetical protein